MLPVGRWRTGTYLLVGYLDCKESDTCSLNLSPFQCIEKLQVEVKASQEKLTAHVSVFSFSSFCFDPMIHTTAVLKMNRNLSEVINEIYPLYNKP